MYSQGETFYYDFDGDDYELTVLENFLWEGKEYIISEDFDGELYVFIYDEDDEEIILIDDADEIKSVVKYWKEEYLLDNDISDFEDDEYYDRVDGISEKDFDKEFDENDDDYY